MIADHATAARFAIEAGFDAVEIHLGHNYLASSFLSPLINRRDDEFGGSLENRAKVARGIVMAVRRAVEKEGTPIAVTAKLNMTDGVRGGISVEESLKTAKWLEEDGGLDAIELTAGSSLVNPMYLFRGDAPIKEFAKGFQPPMRWGVRMTGKKFLREYPYREAYLLRDAKLFRAELKMPLILLGGITNRETMDLAMAEGFDFVAMGRALLAEPDLINRIKADGDRAFRFVDVHALQRVHGHHLHPHPLRGDRIAGPGRNRLAACRQPRLHERDHRLPASHPSPTLEDHQFLRREDVGEVGVVGDVPSALHQGASDVELGIVLQPHAAVLVVPTAVDTNRNQRLFGAADRDGGRRRVASGRGVDEAAIVGLEGPGFGTRLRQVGQDQSDDDRGAQKKHREHRSTQFAVPPDCGLHRPHALADHEVDRQNARRAEVTARS